MASTERVHCIVHPIRRLETWCGRPAAAWVFGGVDHALGNVLRGGPASPCPECVAAAVVALMGTA